MKETGISRRTVLAICSLMLLHTTAMYFDGERIKGIKRPLFAFQIPWSKTGDSSRFIGLGYSVAGTEHHYSSGEPGGLRIQEYRLEHWFLPLTKAYADELKP